MQKPPSFSLPSLQLGCSGMGLMEDQQARIRSCDLAAFMLQSIQEEAIEAVAANGCCTLGFTRTTPHQPLSTGSRYAPASAQTTGLVAGTAVHPECAPPSRASRMIMHLSAILLWVRSSRVSRLADWSFPLLSSCSGSWTKSVLICRIRPAPCCRLQTVHQTLGLCIFVHSGQWRHHFPFGQADGCLDLGKGLGVVEGHLFDCAAIERAHANCPMMARDEKKRRTDATNCRSGPRRQGKSARATFRMAGRVASVNRVRSVGRSVAHLASHRACGNQPIHHADRRQLLGMPVPTILASRLALQRHSTPSHETA